MSILSPDQVSRYQRDGFVFPVPVLSSEEAMRYIAPEMRQLVGARDYAALVHGQDRVGHFAPYTRPQTALASDVLLLAARVKADREAYLFRGAEHRRPEPG